MSFWNKKCETMRDRVVAGLIVAGVSALPGSFFLFQVWRWEIWTAFGNKLETWILDRTVAELVLGAICFSFALSIILLCRRVVSLKSVINHKDIEIQWLEVALEKAEYHLTKDVSKGKGEFTKRISLIESTVKAIGRLIG